MKKQSLTILLMVLMTVQPASATELFETHTSARAMGMGGSYIALVDNEESLFVNPAGLAKNSGFYWTMADPHVGLSDNAVDFIDDAENSPYNKLKDQNTFGEGLQDLYGEPLWVGGGAKSAVMMPFFAFAYYSDIDASFIVDNPVNPALEVNFVRDQGYALGTGWSLGGVFQMGFATRYVARQGIRKTYGIGAISGILNGDDPSDVIFDEIENTKGTGYAFDMGFNITVPSPVSPTISLAWTNIGNTKFEPEEEGGEAPPTEMSNMTVGGAMMVDAALVHVAPSFEVRHVNDADVQLGKKLHLGLELGLPILTARAGFYQGYFTYGAGMDMGLLQVDFASWGAELGAAPGQLESRRYFVQATLRIGFDLFGGGSTGGKGSGKSGSKGSSRSSTRRAAKVRR